MAHIPPPSDPADSSKGLPIRTHPVDVQRAVAMKAPGRPDPGLSQQEGISPAFLWRVFCQWWRWAVPLGLLLSTAAGLLVLHLHVPEYEATAMIMIEASGPYIAFEKDANTRGSVRYVATQIELLRSPVVLAPVLARPAIASLSELSQQADPLSHLQAQLKIQQIGKSELYNIHYVSSSASDAAQVANGVVAEYLSMQSDEDFLRSQRVIDVLEEERLRRSTEVERLRKRVVDLARDITGKDPFGQGAVTNFDRAMSPVGGLYQSLTEVDVNSEILKAEIQALRDTPILVPDHAQTSGLLDLEIASRADVRELEAKIEAIDENLKFIKDLPRKRIGENWENDPNYVRLVQESSDAKTELTELKAMLRKELHGLRMEERKTQHARQIEMKEQELNSLMTRASLLSNRFNEHLEELKSGGAQSVQLEFARAELAREERVFELIAARKLALQTELRAPARVALKQSASVPRRALEPIPYKLLFIACLASLVSPLALAVAREVTIKRITGPEQLTNESLLPILGELARFPVRPVATEHKALPSRQQREMFIFAESVDSLRTNLMLTENVGAEGQQRVIAIASAASGEGKTSVATSLAVSISGATKKPTLLIDADLRSPDVAEVLGVRTHPGLAEVLAGKSDLGDAIHRVGKTNTYVLPAGRHRVNPHHVVNGTKVESLFATLRTKFPTILVDTPPVLGASESLIYAHAADLVVFCSLTEVSRSKQVRVAVDRLQTTGANVAGAVLSGVPIGRYTYAYGYDAERAT